MIAQYSAVFCFASLPFILIMQMCPLVPAYTSFHRKELSLYGLATVTMGWEGWEGMASAGKGCQGLARDGKCRQGLKCVGKWLTLVGKGHKG
jgi:hypothetical protein